MKNKGFTIIDSLVSIVVITIMFSFAWSIVKVVTVRNRDNYIERYVYLEVNNLMTIFTYDPNNFRNNLSLIYLDKYQDDKDEIICYYQYSKYKQIVIKYKLNYYSQLVDAGIISGLRIEVIDELGKQMVILPNDFYEREVLTNEEE